MNHLKYVFVVIVVLHDRYFDKSSNHTKFSFNGIILCWLITLCVFILPDVSLSIVLDDTVSHWFSTTRGSFLLSSTITRNRLNIPCIVILYFQYKQQSKRDKSLKQALTPIKKNIANRDLLKNYQNIELSKKVSHYKSLNCSNNNNANMRMYRYQPDTFVNVQANMKRCFYNK
jgi:hypothetical protein